MRATFELCVKVVGLVLCCSGAIAMLLGILSWLHQPDSGAFYPQGALGEQLRSQVRTATSSQAGWTAIHLLLGGAIPTGLGLYLMRFGGPVVRFCYPERDRVTVTRGPAAGLDLKVDAVSQDAEVSQPKGEQKYAPPGYFKPEA